MNEKVEVLTDLYNNTNKLYSLIKETSKKEIENKKQENLQQIENYLMSKLPEIKALNCKFYMRGRTYNESDEPITGFCLVFCGCWLITEEGVFYESEGNHYIGDDYYYKSGGRRHWKSLKELSDSKVNDPYNGLFVRWKEMKSKLNKDLEKIAQNRIENLQSTIKNSAKRVSAIMDFKI